METFLIEMKHGPETCALHNSDANHNFKHAMDEHEKEFDNANVEIVGWWWAASAHIGWMVAKAKTAHTIEILLLELKLSSWNTCTILPAHEAGETHNNWGDLELK